MSAFVMIIGAGASSSNACHARSPSPTRPSSSSPADHRADRRAGSAAARYFRFVEITHLQQRASSIG